MTGNCPVCNRVPEPLADVGQVFIWAPTPHTEGKVKRAARDCGIDTADHGEGCLGLDLARARGARPLDGLTATLRWDLSLQEAHDARALTAGQDAAIGLAELGRVTSLETLMGQVESRWLLTMLGEDRLTSHYQPIVAVSRPEEIYAFESLLRGDDGQGGTVSGGRLIAAARDADLLFQIDYAARASAVRNRPNGEAQARLFVNFSPAAIYDPVYCLRETVKLIEERGIAPDDVVFEVTESEKIGDLDHLKGILNYYRDRGFGVALDDLGSGYASLNLLHELRPDYVKIDMDLISGVESDPVKATIASKVIETARALGIPSVAEGIENARDLAWVREAGADYAQGFYIGRPSPAGQLAAAG